VVSASKGLTGDVKTETILLEYCYKLIETHYPLLETTAGYQAKKTGTAAFPVATGWRKRGAVMAKCDKYSAVKKHRAYLSTIGDA
jgi:hypothetical protein